MKMTDEIRALVEARLKEVGMSRADLARAVDTPAPHISRALNNTGDRGGKVPDLWAGIFEALGLRLTLEVIGEARKPGEEEGGEDLEAPGAGSPGPRRAKGRR